MSNHLFYTRPPRVSRALVAFPTIHIMLVTLDRPVDLNCIDTFGSHELDALWKWYDSEPTLRCAAITGSGRAFCTGVDLKGTLVALHRGLISQILRILPHTRLAQPVSFPHMHRNPRHARPLHARLPSPQGWLRRHVDADRQKTRHRRSQRPRLRRRLRNGLER